MKTKESSHDLCIIISGYISLLRESLKELEESAPSLFSGHEPPIRSNWEFWTTDEILETIHSDIQGALTNSPHIRKKESQK